MKYIILLLLLSGCSQNCKKIRVVKVSYVNSYGYLVVLAEDGFKYTVYETIKNNKIEVCE